MPYRPTRDPVVLLLAVIVIAAVMAMVTGIGVTLGGDSGSGPVFPFPEGGENETLSISVNRTTLAPGDTVAVTVTWVGDGPVRNATVTTAGRRYRTGSDGTVVIAFEEPGTYEIAARLPGENETASTATIAEVQVRRATTQSSLVASRTGFHAESTRNRFSVRIGSVRASTGGIDSRIRPNVFNSGFESYTGLSKRRKTSAPVE